MVSIEDGRIVLIRADVIPDDQAWFWTPEWQEGERQADEEYARGEGRIAYSAEGFVAALANEAGLDSADFL